MRGVASTVFWMSSYFGMFAIGGPILGGLADHQSIAFAMSLAGTSVIKSFAQIAFAELQILGLAGVWTVQKSNMPRYIQIRARGSLG